MSSKCLEVGLLVNVQEHQAWEVIATLPVKMKDGLGPGLQTDPSVGACVWEVIYTLDTV